MPDIRWNKCLFAEIRWGTAKSHSLNLRCAQNVTKLDLIKCWFGTFGGKGRTPSSDKPKFEFLLLPSKFWRGLRKGEFWILCSQPLNRKGFSALTVTEQELWSNVTQCIVLYLTKWIVCCAPPVILEEYKWFWDSSGLGALMLNIHNVGAQWTYTLIWLNFCPPPFCCNTFSATICVHPLAIPYSILSFWHRC